MAVILYSNGLTEELSPKEHTFSDQEILNLFVEFDNMKTQRLDEVPNTWCVWGEFKNPVADDYNKLGSDVLQLHCYSHVVFLHDTEVNPSWNLSESIIHHGYADFKKTLLLFLDDVARQTLEEIAQARQQQGTPSLMSLVQVAISIDKRVIFSLDPDGQPPDFYGKENFPGFAEKCYNFLKVNYKDGDVFAIFADKKMIIVLTDDKVKTFIDRLIKVYQDKEDYLKCAELNEIYKKWSAYKASKVPPPEKKKRGRPPTKKKDETPTK